MEGGSREGTADELAGDGDPAVPEVESQHRHHCEYSMAHPEPTGAPGGDREPAGEPQERDPGRVLDRE